MTKEVIEVPFEGVAARKLHDLFERGYTVCGVAIQRPSLVTDADRGAITTGGMVMWWQKLFSGDELEASNVQHPSNALQLAEALHEMANTYLPTGGDFVPGPRSKADELIDEAASELRRQHARIAELEAENNGLRILASGGMELFERYSTFKAKCEELEAMLDAVGAGGVGESIKPKVQADTSQEPGTGIPASVPTGWKLVPVEPTAAMLDAAFDTEVVHTEWGVDAFVENTAEVYGAMLAAAPEAPAQQKPVAHLPCCGYADTSALKWNPYNSVAQCHNCGQVYAAPPPPAPAQQPVATVAEVHMSRYTIEWANGPLPEGTQLYTAPQPTENLRCKSTQKRLATLWGYVKKEPDHFRDAAQMVPARQPLTDEKLYALYCEAMKGYYVSSLHHWRDAEAHKFARAIEAAHGITGGQQ